MSTVEPSAERTPSEGPRASYLADAFPSVGIGLLVGVLVGLSVSPVVAGLLTTLGGLLATLLGLQQDSTGDSGTALSRLRVNGVRIGAFGFASVLGVAGGLYVRNHNVFTPPVKEQIAAWQEAGYSRDEAKQFVALQRFGLTPEGRQIVQSDVQKTQASALFGALSDVNLCDKLSTRQFNGDPERIAQQYRTQNVGDETDKRTPLYRTLGDLADHVQRVPREEQATIFQDLENFICAVQRLEPK